LTHKQHTSGLGPGPSALDTGRSIGLLGGTFDPVHNGHIRIAIEALEALGLAEVRLIPLAEAVHRDPPLASPAQRLAMLEAATASVPGLVVDGREIAREGPSYTIDTLCSLHDDFPEQSLCLLLGGDAFNGFGDWHRPVDVLTLANLAILERPGFEVAETVRPLYDQRRVGRLDPALTGQIVDCPVTQLAISASDVRRRRSAGLSLVGLVPDPVRELITDFGLYRA
jgi:nicotinate-nucleotide adenylyltransferase